MIFNIVMIVIAVVLAAVGVIFAYRKRERSFKCTSFFR